MRFSARKQGMTAVVDLDGPLTAGEDLAGLGQLAGVAKAVGADHVVLNLAGVGRLDCTGIGALVRLRGALRECGVTLHLIHVAPRQARMFELAGLLQILDVPGQAMPTSRPAPPVARTASSLGSLLFRSVGRIGASAAVATS